ncbi:uncharacterized protein LOC126410285 [Nymphaea colorata]|uniref:uncharacterized protein LOC126410285 n=1 Tax=Nymphaea colorata TaxID=210225 RepID=UPI00214F0709|nr:uncharacterized protein LOC126410285 [Nymphaea colorata]
MSGSNNIALAARSSPTSYTKRNQARMPNATRNRPRPKCDHCGLLGHIKSRCYVLHGYPPNHPKATCSTSDSSKIEQAQQGRTSANNVKVNAVLSQLTEEQVSQLASWLNVDTSPAAANLAGPFVEEADWSG